MCPVLQASHPEIAAIAGSVDLLQASHPELAAIILYVGVRVKPRNCIWNFFQEATKMIYFDLKSDAEY